MDNRTIASILDCEENELEFLTDSLGMTNSTQVVQVDGKKYVVRQPGLGSDKLVDRDNEYEAYQLIKDKGLSDNMIYYDKESGLKITKYVEDAHNADINNKDDLRRILDKLKEFHSLNDAEGVTAR